MDDDLQELLTKVISSNQIVIKNQVALDDKFSDMCIDISEALGNISTAMQSISGEPVLEKEEEINETRSITYS